MPQANNLANNLMEAVHFILQQPILICKNSTLVVCTKYTLVAQNNRLISADVLGDKLNSHLVPNFNYAYV